MNVASVAGQVPRRVNEHPWDEFGIFTYYVHLKNQPDVEAIYNGPMDGIDGSGYYGKYQDTRLNV